MGGCKRHRIAKILGHRCIHFFFHGDGKRYFRGKYLVNVIVTLELNGPYDYVNGDDMHMECFLKFKSS